MSQENVELVRALQPQPDMDLVALFRDEANATATMKALAPRFHDDFETFLTVILEPRRYEGMDGLRDAWLDWLEPWESYRADIEDVIDAGDDVVVLTRDYGRRRGMSAEVPMVGTAVWTVRDSKVARVRFYPHRGDALEAARLRE